MTEYDFSPAAQQAYQQKLQQIAKWSANVPSGDLEKLSNPFVPSTPASGSTADLSRPPHRSKSKSHHRRGRSRSRRRAYYSDSSSSDSEYGGPDRPPTPPASAPIYGTHGGTGAYGHSALRASHSLNSNAVMVPVWNGTAWVLQPQSPAGASTLQGAPSPAGSPGMPSQVYPPLSYLSPPAFYPPPVHHTPDQERGRRKETKPSRPKPHRRDSRSVPPAAYGSFLYNTIPNNANYLYPQKPISPVPQIQPESATPSPSSSVNPSLPNWPAARSAPTPLVSPGTAGGGYFAMQPQQYPQGMLVLSPAGSLHSGQTGPPPMPPHIHAPYPLVSSPLASAPVLGHGGAVYTPPPPHLGGYAYPSFASPPPGGAVGYPYGIPQPYGYGVQGPVEGMQTKKRKEGSRRSFFGKLTGGM